MPEIGVRRVLASDGSRVRGIRLEALADPAASIAFLETLEAAQRKPEEYWQQRAVGAALSDAAAQFVAEDGREWVGTATVLIPVPGSVDYFGRTHRAGRALLVAVFVRESHRGRGVLEGLADAAGEWARGRGRRELALDVHDENGRAQRAYTRLGFADTGIRSTGPNGIEREMVRVLA